MTPADVAKLRENQERVAKTIRLNESAIRQSQRKEERYSATLRRSQEAVEGARRTLRKAGYLKK